MGEKTGIEWTDSTWNPFVGCRRVSVGCANCYMFREQKRYGNEPTRIHRTSGETFNAPLKWKSPRKVFVCSWSDFWLTDADEWRVDAWEVMRQAPQHTYQILTKRPENILDRLPDDWGAGWPNVWLGASVENQEYANRRIPLLLQVPAVVRFLSVEPMLGMLNIQGYLLAGWHKYDPKIKWVIVGCESGPGGLGRPTDIDWLRFLRYQCETAGTPFFLKQMGIGGKLVKMPELDGKIWAKFPAERSQA